MIFEGVNWNSEFESGDYLHAKRSADQFSSDLSTDKLPTLTIAYRYRRAVLEYEITPLEII